MHCRNRHMTEKLMAYITYTHKLRYACTYAHTCTYTHINILLRYACTYAHTRIYTHINILLRYACTYAHTRTYTQIKTNIHACIQKTQIYIQDIQCTSETACMRFNKLTSHSRILNFINQEISTKTSPKDD